MTNGDGRSSTHRRAFVSVFRLRRPRDRDRDDADPPRAGGAQIGRRRRARYSRRCSSTAELAIFVHSAEHSSASPVSSHRSRFQPLIPTLGGQACRDRPHAAPLRDVSNMLRFTTPAAADALASSTPVAATPQIGASPRRAHFWAGSSLATRRSTNVARELLRPGLRRSTNRFRPASRSDSRCGRRAVLAKPGLALDVTPGYSRPSAGLP